MINFFSIKKETLGKQIKFDLKEKTTSAVQSFSKIIFVSKYNLIEKMKLLMWFPSKSPIYIITPNCLKGKKKVYFRGRFLNTSHL